MLGRYGRTHPIQKPCLHSNVMAVEPPLAVDPFLHKESAEEPMTLSPFFDEDLFSDMLANPNSICQNLPDLFESRLTKNPVLLKTTILIK